MEDHNFFQVQFSHFSLPICSITISFCENCFLVWKESFLSLLLLFSLFIIIYQSEEKYFFQPFPEFNRHRVENLINKDRRTFRYLSI